MDVHHEQALTQLNQGHFDDDRKTRPNPSSQYTSCPAYNQHLNYAMTAARPRCHNRAPLIFWDLAARGLRHQFLAQKQGSMMHNN